MRLFRSFFLLGLFLTAGCHTTITNLTPSEQIRNGNGLYPFEAAWRSNRQTIRSDSIKAYVLVGMNSYPMQPVPLVKNRWEILVPIPADQDFVAYRYKFDYKYRSIPEPRSSSKLSPQYTLRISGK